MAAYEVLLLNTAIPQIQAAQSGDTYVVPRDIAINATAIISANSATDALRITQTGAGNALVVEDSANPDSTPFVVTATGNVGIGTSSPGAKLDIVTSSTIAGVRVNNTTAGKSGMVIQNNGSTVGIIGLTGLWNGDSDTNFGLYAETGSDIRFSTNGVAAPKAIIDTYGNLGLGVTPSAANLGKALQITNASFVGYSNNAYVGANWYYGSGDKYIADGFASLYAQDSSVHKWYIAPSGTAGNAITFTQAMTLDASGDLAIGRTSVTTIGTGYRTIDMDGENGSGLRFRTNGTSVGSVYVVGTSYLELGTIGSAYLRFAVNGGDEKARITSGGAFLVGTGDVGSNSGIGLKAVYSATEPYYACVGSSTANNKYSYLLYSTGAAAFRFYVGYDGTVSATNTTISGISDSRLKENIRDLDVGLNAILALKPRKFDWKAGKGKDKKDDRGFIAQEFEQVFPDLVDEWLDPAPEGEEPYKSVRQDLIPVLVKAIQEQQAMINELKAEMAALKGV